MHTNEQRQDGVTVERLTHPESCEGDEWPALPTHFLSVNLARPVQLAQRRGALTREHLFLPGEFLLMPAHTPSRWQCAGATETLFLRVRPQVLERVAAGCGVVPESVELLPTFGTRDPRVFQIAETLEAEMRGGSLGGRLYADTLAIQLSLHLLRRYSALASPAPDAPDPLPRPALRRAIEFLHEHMEREVTLSELAEAAGLSDAHFARQFKRSVGLAPHQYLIHCRVEAAKALLSSGALPVGEVAHRVGFGSQSHLSRHFKRLVGVTPKRFMG